jgi:hypothetical protein
LLQSRELNPHFANGGDGVPPPKAPGSAIAAAAPRPAGVGDGGTSWRLKALRRAQATAAEEGKDVREVRSVDCLQGARGPGSGSDDGQRIRGIVQCCRLHKSVRRWKRFCSLNSGAAAALRPQLRTKASACLQRDLTCAEMQVVAERWGSLNSLTAGLTEQKAAHGELPLVKDRAVRVQHIEACRNPAVRLLSSAALYWRACPQLHASRLPPACMHSTSVRAQAVLSNTVFLLHATAKAHMAAARERRQAAGGGEDQQQRRPDAPVYLQVANCVTPDGVQRG